MSTLQHIIDYPINQIQPKGNFALFKIKKTCEYQKSNQIKKAKQTLKTLNRIAFGQSIDDPKYQEIKPAPYLQYNVNYSAIDPHLQNIKLQGKKMKRSKTEHQQIEEVVDRRRTDPYPNPKLIIPKLRIQYHKPISYFDMNIFQPMSNDEIEKSFEQIICKHKVKLPRLPQI